MNLRLAMLSVLSFLTGSLFAGNLSIDSLTMATDSIAELKISLTTPSEPYTAFQFDLVLPEGIQIAADEDNNLLARLSVDGDDDHVLRVGFAPETEDNIYRLLVFSMENKQLALSEDASLILTLKAADGISLGEKVARVTSQVFVADGTVDSEMEDVDFIVTVEDKETVGIHPVKAGSPVNEGLWYDLRGQRIENPKKGLYINSGKKVFVE